MNAFAQKVKKLADGTVKAFIRLEDADFTHPVLAAISIFKGDIILTEKVEQVGDTMQLPAVLSDYVEMNPDKTVILDKPSKWKRDVFNRMIAS